MEDVELNRKGGNSDGKLYLNRLLSAGKTAPIPEIKAEELKVPVWYDKKKYQRAMEVLNRHSFSYLLASLMGLIVVLAIESILNVLVCTRQSSTPKTAYRRYLRTVFHVFNFYEYLPENDSKCVKSLLDVRQKHERSSKMAHKRSIGFINQRDMAITQFGFFGFILLRHQRLGMKCKQEDLEAIVHMWRVLGYMLGIEDQYNLCTASYEETLIRVKEVLNHVITPVMYRPPEKDFSEMLDAMLTGLWSYVPIITTPSFLFLAKMISGVPGYMYSDDDRTEQLIYLKTYPNHIDKAKELEKELRSQAKCPSLEELHWWSRFVVNLVNYVCHLCYVSVLARMFFNWHMSVSRFLVTYLPFLAFHRFGVRDSYVRILRKSGEEKSVEVEQP